VFWLRRGMPESARWEKASERRRAAQEQRRSGAVLEGENVALTRFTVADMFLDPSVRRRLVPAFLMMLSVTFGFWGVATFVPTYVGTIAAKAGLKPQLVHYYFRTMDDLFVEVFRRRAEENVSRVERAIGADGSLCPENIIRFSLLSALSTQSDPPSAAARPFGALARLIMPSASGM